MRSGTSMSRAAGALLAAAGLAAAAAGGCTDPAASGKKSGSTGCPDDLAFFEANVYSPVLVKQCAVCHAPGGLAGRSHLVLMPPDEDGALEANFEIVKTVAGMKVNGESILLLRPSGRHPDGHPGGTLIPFDSPTYHTFETFVARVTEGKHCDDGGPAQGCVTAAPGLRSLRRLSRVEYDRTVRDLLGIESTWGASFAADTVVGGFDNNAAALHVTPLFAEQARKAAEEIAEAVDLAQVLPCPEASGDAACAAKLVADLGARAFRRPLGKADQDRYVALHAAVTADEGFSAGVRAVIAAMLQSPHFLYRKELGSAGADGKYTLDGWEVASELSYLLWASMPDQELFDAAAAGKLSTRAQIAAQARRLLADPRADVVLSRFVEQWLEIDRLPTVPKDSGAYPTFDGSIRASMRGETQRFVKHVVRKGTGTLPELLTARYSFVDDTLAAFYGLPAPSGAADDGGFRKVDFADDARRGLVTQGSVIATHSRPNESSPIHRGKLVREKLLCQPLPPPPPSVNVAPPPVDPTLTTRERFAAHATMEPCKSCHHLIDPIGFGFEHFDGVGRYRAEEAGMPIDATGEVQGTESPIGAFDGTAELANDLAASTDVRACFAHQWFRFGYGVEETPDLACLADQVADGFLKGDLKIEELLVALTQTPRFTERTGEGDEQPVPPDQGAGGGGAGGGSSGDPPDAGDPGTGDALDVQTKVDSQWNTGSCSSVTVTNTGSMSVTWTITLDVGGSVSDVWNAVAAPAGSKTAFSGVSWNAVLEPQGAASFGYCMHF